MKLLSDKKSSDKSFLAFEAHLAFALITFYFVEVLQLVSCALNILSLSLLCCYIFIRNLCNSFVTKYPVFKSSAF